MKRGGLKGLCDTLGIGHTTKDLLKAYKGVMEKCLETQERFDLFVNYGIEDVVSLSLVPTRMVSFINQISTDTLQMPKEFEFTEENIPSTIGSVVARFFQNYILYELSSSLTDHNLKEPKDGRTLKESMDRLERIRKKMAIDRNIIQVPTKKKKGKKSQKYTISDFLNGCSVKTLGYLHLNTTGILNTLVQGGRTNNEKYWDYQAFDVFDIDLSSCYANALKNFVYPIGLPTIDAYANTDDCPTLKEFLIQNEKDLVDNLYTITISGNIKFDQNLLYSKITDSLKLTKRVNQLIQEEECLEDLTGDFVIFTKELQNTILTSDLLKTIRAVCTNNELKEIMESRVMTAAFYRKSDRIDSIADWVVFMEDNLLEDDYEYVSEYQSILDKRSRKWSYIKLDYLFETLIEKRKSIKKEIKIDLEKGDPLGIVDQFKALEQILKLIGNTIFGVISSPYFDIGNTILANNITAKARNAIWLVSRALNGYQTITDGTAYQVKEVFQFRHQTKDTNVSDLASQKRNKIKKPGLEILSDFRKLAKHRSIMKGPLMGVNWDDVFLSKNLNHPDLLLVDQYATKHIRDFLEVYDLKLDYDVEHKIENVASKLFYIKKAHYIFQNNLTKDIIYKVRGTSERENPIYLQLAEQIFRGEDTQTEFFQLERNINRISSIHDYKLSKKKKLKESTLSQKNELILPGYNYVEKKIFRLNSLDLPYENIQEYKRRHTVNGCKEYGHLLNEIPFSQIFDLRLKEYLSNR